MMTRNLKALGLALVAVFALSAVAASAASAQTVGKLTVDSGTSVTLDGSEDGANTLVYPGLEGNVECPGSSIVGHKVETHAETTTKIAMKEPTHPLIPANSSDATITPNFVNCKNGGHKVTVTMNGCDFDFHIGLTTAIADTYALTADVHCPPGASIEVHVYLASNNSNTTICTLTVHEQTGITGFDIANEVNAKGETETMTLTATGTAKNIKVTKSGLCGAGETSVAEQTINYTLKGTTATGLPVGVTITH